MKALVVTVHVKPMRRETFIEEVIKEAVGSEENEPGCFMFNVTQETGNPDVLHLFEVYRDAGAVDTHANTPHILQFLKTTGEWLTEPTQVIDCETLYPPQAAWRKRPAPSNATRAATQNFWPVLSVDRFLIHPTGGELPSVGVRMHRARR